METRLLVYLIDFGLIWLREKDGVLTGWDEVPVWACNVYEIAAIEIGEVRYRICFCYADAKWEGRVKWAERVKDARAEYLDNWGLPEERMRLWEAVGLQILLRDHAVKPVATEVTEAQAA